MLVLTRKKGEKIIIDNDIEVSVVDIKGDQIRIGIKAPKNISILRKEILDFVKEENQTALQIEGADLNQIANLLEENRKTK